MFHDAASAAKTAEGRRRGVRGPEPAGRHPPPDAPPLKLESVADVADTLAEASNIVRTGRLAGTLVVVIVHGRKEPFQLVSHKSPGVVYWTSRRGHLAIVRKTDTRSFPVTFDQSAGRADTELSFGRVGRAKLWGGPPANGG
jgi:hypothetical protein